MRESEYGDGAYQLFSFCVLFDGRFADYESVANGLSQDLLLLDGDGLPTDASPVELTACR